MTTWYEAGESMWRPEINAVEVDRETESSVYIRGRRNAKSSTHTSYFRTWEEAHQHLLAYTQRQVDSLRSQLERANSVHGNVKGMKKPESA